MVEAYAEADLREGPDGRLRFSFCPSAAVVACSEMTPPPVAQVPTLFVAAERSMLDQARQLRRCAGELVERLE